MGDHNNLRSQSSLCGGGKIWKAAKIRRRLHFCCVNSLMMLGVMIFNNNWHYFLVSMMLLLLHTC